MTMRKVRQINSKMALLITLTFWSVMLFDCPRLYPSNTPIADLRPPAVSDIGFIGISPDKRSFIRSSDGSRFTPWGFNYDHDENGRLLEDYWGAEWQKVIEDFREMKNLGANVVRIHLQFGRFINEDGQPKASAIDKLTDLVELAEQTGLYLDITGLGCYHKKDVPPWYDKLTEKDRWDMQAEFWQAIAATCAQSPAVFCYDLMNEPVVSGGDKVETEWLLGELGGKFFVQRINLDPAGRSAHQVAKQWVDKMTAAVRRHDRRRLITVGVIPWVLVWPTAKPLFYSPEVAENLDFASVHFYPKSGEIDKALSALKAYNIGKPVVVEEMFPLTCSGHDLRQFITASSSTGYAQGWISFYWGRKPDEYTPDDGISGAITKQWLLEFCKISSEVLK